MIYAKASGDFSKTIKYLKKDRSNIIQKTIRQYANEGLLALKAATPIKTGKTSSSWSYDIIIKKEKIYIIYKNDNMVDGVPIAILLQYGHATKNGGFVTGIDYINPAIKPTFEKIASRAWEEMKIHER